MSGSIASRSSQAIAGQSARIIPSNLSSVCIMGTRLNDGYERPQRPINHMSITSSQTRAQGLGPDKAEALALTPVSRETERRLDRYVELLLEWQGQTNLVAARGPPLL